MSIYGEIIGQFIKPAECKNSIDNQFNVTKIKGGKSSFSEEDVDVIFKKLKQSCVIYDFTGVKSLLGRNVRRKNPTNILRCL